MIIHSTRALLSTLVAILLGGLFLAFHCSKAPERIIVVGFGGTYQDLQRQLIFEPFAGKSGIEVKDVSYAGEYGQLKSDIQQGRNDWDVVQVESPFMLEAGAEGLIEILRDPILDTLDFVESAKSEHGIAHLGWATVLTWNRSKFDPDIPDPVDWTALWDLERYPGLRGLRKTPRGNLELALLADGVSPDKLYPLDVERGLRKLGEIRQYVDWWTSGAELQQKLVSIYVLAMAWNGRVWALMKEGEPVDMTLNQGIVDYDWWVVPRGRPKSHVKTAFEFLLFASQPEIQIEISKRYGYAPTRAGALEQLSPEVKKYMPTTKENLAHEVMFNTKWWSENEEWIARRWNDWLLE